MGCFDSVYARCPKCGERIEFQTKAHNCLLTDYNVNEAIPLSIVADLDGATKRCECGESVTLATKSTLTLTVK